MIMVICATCGSAHPSLFGGEYQQGEGCSATVYEREGKRYLIGHYGSVVADMRRFELRPDSKVELGNCCDNCIDGLIIAGKAKLIEEGAWS